MSRMYLNSIAWLLLLVGVVLILFDIKIWGLICCYLGAFMRLIYNSEKYKFYKYCHIQLLKEFGPTLFQRQSMSTCLWAFYRGLIDFAIIVIIPFFLIPQLDFAWWGNIILAIVYILSLKPIFKGISDEDRQIVDNIIDSYRKKVMGIL